jgi:hypothetical protein
MYASDVTAFGGGLWPEGEGSVKGAEAIIHNLESIMAAFERSELIPELFLEVDETLVVPLLWRGILPDSESAIEQHLVCAYRFSGDLISYIAWFADLDEAFDSLGLPRSAAVELGADGEPSRSS